VAAPETASYDERLTVPWWWWPIGAAVAAVGGLELHVGFPWYVPLATEVVLLALVAAGLLAAGRTKITVSGTTLRAGSAELALDDVALVRVLDDEEWRHRLGPGADVRAHLITRPWLHTGVEIDLGAASPEPYWLVSSRRPTALATALRHACGAPSQQGSM
jgi:hypothetical protein